MGKGWLLMGTLETLCLKNEVEKRPTGINKRPYRNQENKNNTGTSKSSSWISLEITPKTLPFFRYYSKYYFKNLTAITCRSSSNSAIDFGTISYKISFEDIFMS